MNCTCGGLRLIGDVHGNALVLHTLSGGGGDSIQIGDFGFGFGAETDADLQLSLDLRPRLRFIRGNHDNPGMCKRHPGHIPSGMHRGIFFVGGGHSIDKEYRLAHGFGWWPDEEHSLLEMRHLAEVYHEEKPEMVISHEGPWDVCMSMFTPMHRTPSRTGLFLQSLLDIHQPKLWVFGHWHRSVSRREGPTWFQCVGEDMSWNTHYPDCGVWGA